MPDMPDPDLERLIPQLASPDPSIRDDLALPLVADAVLEGRLRDDQLVWLGETMVGHLAYREVWARSFAPLVLAVLAEAGTTRAAWVEGVRDWYVAETDLRGHDPEHGWLHAVAHGADALAAFGLAGAAPVVPLLDALAQRLVAPTDHVWRDQEDDRVAYAAARLLTVPDLAEDEATGWLAPVATLLADGEPGPVPGEVSNSLRTLRSLSLALEHQVLVAGEPVAVPHAAAVRRAVADALRPPTAWMWR